jgi:hypothetical protein
MIMEKIWMAGGTTKRTPILRIGLATLAQIANDCLLSPEREWARDRQCYARQEPENRTGNRKPGLRLYHQALDLWRRVTRARAGCCLILRAQFSMINSALLPEVVVQTLFIAMNLRKLSFVTTLWTVAGVGE